MTEIAEQDGSKSTGRRKDYLEEFVAGRYSKSFGEWLGERAALGSVAFRDGKRATPGVVYLASPYSSPDARTRTIRYFEAGRYAAFLMRSGCYVFSPIVHSHPLAEAFGLPGDWGFWRGYDLAMLSACTSLDVLMLPGWRDSKGVAEETAYAIQQGKPVRYVAADWQEE